MKKTIYQVNGYKNRLDYLTCIADDFAIDIELVFQCAQLLGACEDFDGLIATLQDYSQ